MKINFEDWDPSVFRSALASERLVFLFISVSWSQSCRLSDETTLIDPRVVEFVENNFAAIRLDAELRPDINRRYNQGGYPSNVFLSPGGEIVTGATFLPAADFLEIARGVVTLSRSLTQKDRLLGLSRPNRVPVTQKAPLDLRTKRAIFESEKVVFLFNFEREIKLAFDPVFGGFGRSGKSTNFEILDFCFQRYLKTRNKELLGILNKSLEAMAEGRMFDHVEGGFFRGTADRRFESPRFEKLAEDNFRLCDLYHRVGEAFGNNQFLEISKRTRSFLENFLKGETFYYSSVAASEVYYSSSSDERRRRERPAVDTRFFASLNGLAAYGLSFLEREKASELTDRLFLSSRDKAGLFYRQLNHPSPARFLIDQVYPLLALVTLSPPSSAEVMSFLKSLIFNFYDEAGAGFFDRESEEESIGLLKEKSKPLTENLLLADILSRCNFSEKAEETLVETFFLYNKPVLTHAPLAAFLSASI